MILIGKIFLNALEVKQIAFTASKALNITAKEAVEKIRNNLPSKFTLRNSWTKKGIAFAGCNKGTGRICRLLSDQRTGIWQIRKREEKGSPKTRLSRSRMG